MHAHNVYFSLKDTSDEAVQSLIDDAGTYLSVIDGIVSYACGRLSDLDRDVSDRDFEVGLHVLFESREAHDAYQLDPSHDVFIERQKDNWDTVRVFDTAIE